MDLEDIPEGDQDISIPAITLLGGRPFEDTYIIARQGDEFLTVDGWFDLDELRERYE